MSGEADKTVYLLDISFFVFRAYHALPPLSTADGVPTNAVHGVANMIERLVRLEKPHYLAACFDSPGPTFRREMFEEYKANRDEPDEELRVQFPLVRRLVAAMNIPAVELSGFEADDLLATLAARWEGNGRRVVIVTGDKDLMQCVTDKVTLLDPVRDRRIGFDEVREKFGVAPEAVPDVLGLMGDSSDNIPGVRGVGPKGATALISHFGSVEAMLGDTAAIEELSVRGAKSMRKKVEEHADMARLCRELALVRRDVPLEVELEELDVASLTGPALTAIADELEMGRLVARMEALDSERGVDSYVAESAGPSAKLGAEPSAEAPALDGAADDWETSAAEDSVPEVPFDALGAGPVLVLLDRDESGVPTLLAQGGAGRARAADDEAVREALRVLSGVALVGFDLKGLCRDYGAALAEDALDLGVASYLVDPSVGDHEPASVVERYLSEPLATTASGRFEQLDRLQSRLAAELDERGQTSLYRELEHPLVGVLAAIEARGLIVDADKLGALSADFAGRMEALIGRIYEAAGVEFNILSPVQLRDVLFEKLGLPTKGIKKTKTGWSTDGDSLAALSAEHALPALVLEYRGLAKLKSTYVDTLPKLIAADGRIHTRLNQTVTATGRLSSKDPNLQNIPIRSADGVRIRQAFVAAPGHRLISADYNQIELRVLAHLAGDANLIAAFDSGLDIHSATAAELFSVDAADVDASMRRESKVVNYGIVYGMGPVRLSRELGIDRKRASGIIARYFERYPGVQEFYDRMLDQARASGFVETMFGRRRYLPDITSDHGGRRQVAERVATNTPIQGSAADLIKRAMVDLAPLLADQCPATAMVLQIHDELLLEAPEAEVDAARGLVRRVMESAADLVVPIVVDVGDGPDWAAAH